MTVRLTDDEARWLRVRAQGFAGGDAPPRTVEDVVRGCGGLQAQDARQAPLAVRARGAGLTAADVEAARVDDRTIVRTWCLRGTLHYVTTADLSWLLPLVGPVFVGRGARRLAQLGFDEADADRAVGVVRESLASEGPLTRAELADRLLEAGFSFDPDGQAPVHVVRRACLEGVACEATTRDGRATYAPLEAWVSLELALDREAALATLARRFLEANEPATLDDLQSWSGLYRRDVRTGWEAIAEERYEVEVRGEPAWTVTAPDGVDPVDSPTVHLLPTYDGYFLGHRDRSLVLPEADADRVLPGGGLIRAALLVDGLAAGTWRLDRSRATAGVTVEPFAPLSPAVEAALEADAADLGRFLDVDVALTVAP